MNGLKNIIVPAGYSQAAERALLAGSPTGVLFGTRILTFDQLITGDLDLDSLFFRAYEMLREKAAKYPSYAGMTGYPDFARQLFDFERELLAYDIGIDDLPDETAQQRELKGMLKDILEEIPELRKAYEGFRKLDPKEYQVADDLPMSYTEHYLTEQWLKKGARSFPCAPKFAQPQAEFRKAPNSYRELEGLADLLIDKENDLALSEVQIALPKKELGYLLKRIFEERQIPFTGGSYPSRLIDKLWRFIVFLGKPEPDYFRALFQGNAFLSSTAQLAAYYDHFGLAPEDCGKPLELPEGDFDLIDERALADLKWLAAAAERQRLAVKPVLDILFSKDDDNAKIVGIFNYLLGSELLKSDPAEQEAFSQARELIAKALPFRDSLPLLKYTLSSIECHSDVDDGGGVLVASPDQLQPGRQLTVIIDASLKDFLPSPDCSGVINEAYLAKVPGYPELAARLEYQDGLFANISGLAPELIISYSYSSLDGKAQELSPRVSDLIRKIDKQPLKELREHLRDRITEWPAYGYDGYRIRTPAIAAKNIERLYLKGDGAIHGSVSRFETFRQCPFAFYLATGLDIREQSGYQDIDAALMGSLRHRVMEDLLAPHYVYDEAQLTAELDHLFAQLAKLFPRRAAEIAARKRQVADHLALKLRQAEALEQGSFHIQEKEKAVKGLRFEGRPYPIIIKGIIDRADVSPDYYRIIDYKSSDHSFSMTKFQNGEDLQLMTYAKMGSGMISGHRPFGVYYFILRPAVIPEDKARGADDWQSYLIGNKLSGCSFEEGSEGLAQPGLIKTVRDKKPFAEMMQILDEDYARISADIAAGAIQITPSDDGCKFCAFAPICHKAGREKGAEGEPDEL